MTIQEYFGDWSEVLDLKEADRIIRKLSASSHTVCPPVRDIFKAFRMCPLSRLRVVILCQDPYPQKGVATGIALANCQGTERLSPSLEVLRESVIDYTIPHGRINFDSSLEKWEAQGVLMLNSALSCEAGKTGSHTLLWMPFIRTLLTRLSCYQTGIVYVLMGTVAQSFSPCINRQSNHVIHIRHPSFYARTGSAMPSDIWREINTILIGQNGYGIEWYQEES